MHTTVVRSSSITILSLTIVLLLSFGLNDDAFAVTSEFSKPTQQNAYVSYNNATNQISVSWNFDTLPVYSHGKLDGQPAKCAIKGDFYFESDSAISTPNETTKVNAFIPLYYSVITSSPVTITASNDSDANQVSEEIPCTGSFKIDMNAIMSSEANNTPRPDVSIYLTFYYLNSNGVYKTLDHKRIDELAVVYATSRVLTNDVVTSSTIPSKSFKSDVQYVCGEFFISESGNIAPQIGNILFIDPSASDGSLIAHGNNGDNCEKYVYLENDQYVDIGMHGFSDPDLAEGDILNGYHPGSFTLLFSVGSFGSDDSGCSDCIDPTFYYSQHKIIVKDGFVYNNYSTDVIAEHTPTPFLITNVNQTNTMKLKVYDNFGTNAIKWIDVGFGIPSMNHPFAKSEATIEIEFSNNEIVNIEEKDELNLIDFGNITSNRVNCGHIVTTCLEVIIPHIFRDNFEYNMVVISAEDGDNNVVMNYLNDGIEIHGESINEAPTDRVWMQKYLGNTQWDWIDIVRTDRVNDIWTSDDGFEFTSLGGGYTRIAPLGHNPNLID